MIKLEGEIVAWDKRRGVIVISCVYAYDGIDYGHLLKTEVYGDRYDHYLLNGKIDILARDVFVASGDSSLHGYNNLYIITDYIETPFEDPGLDELKERAYDVLKKLK